MTLRNCSPARQNDGRLYGGSGVASSAEEGKKGRHVPPPSCQYQLAGPLAAAPSKWRSGRTLGGKRGGGDAPQVGVERPSTLGHIDGLLPPRALGRRALVLGGLLVPLPGCARLRRGPAPGSTGFGEVFKLSDL